METYVDPRIRPSLADLAAQGVTAARSSDQPTREAFANYRASGTDEVTTLGPEREAKTVEAELRFGDLVDLANPLHHIPVVSSVYRSLTGDEIAPAARILGAMIYAGPVGFVYATADSLFAEISGKPLGDTLVTAVFGSGDEEESSNLAGPAAKSETAAPVEVVPATAGEIQDGNLQTRDQPTGKHEADEPLMGQDALRALAADLQILAGAPTREGGPPIQSASEMTSALPPHENSQPQLNAAFAQKMTEALDKYRAMAEARRLQEERSQATPSPGSPAF